MPKFFSFLFFAVTVPVHAIPLNSSILMFHMLDIARMKSQIDKAIPLGNKQLNFLVTLHHISDPVTREIKSLCYMDGNANSPCRPITAEFIKSFEENLTEGLVYAAQKGIDISVVPHLDDGLQSGFWRNNLVFDPLMKAGDFSYAEAMIWPLARALKAARQAGAHIEFALQGEAGATIFHFAASYSTLLSELRDFFSEEALRTSPTVKIGISLNFNVIAGRNFTYTPEQLNEVQSLVNAVDFLGLSAYASVSATPHAEDLDNSQRIFLKEFAAYHINIPREKPFRYSEVGIGGGTTANNGLVPAQIPAEAAAAPYSGIYGAFNPLKNPWSSDLMEAFRFDFHLALIEYLGHPELQTHKLLSAFLWNANTWDSQGLYDNESQFGDDRIISLIENSNNSD